MKELILNDKYSKRRLRANLGIKMEYNNYIESKLRNYLKNKLDLVDVRLATEKRADDFLLTLVSPFEYEARNFKPFYIIAYISPVGSSYYDYDVLIPGHKPGSYSFYIPLFGNAVVDYLDGKGCQPIYTPGTVDQRLFILSKLYPDIWKKLKTILNKYEEDFQELALGYFELYVDTDIEINSNENSVISEIKKVLVRS